jgi:hypothetical protein
MSRWHGAERIPEPDDLAGWSQHADVISFLIDHHSSNFTVATASLTF